MREQGLISLLLIGAIVFVITVLSSGCASFETALNKSKPFGKCVPPVVAAATCLYDAAKEVSPTGQVP